MLSRCSIHGELVPDEFMEKHHLNPKEKKGPTIPVCVACGDQLHLLFTRKELANKYNTLEKLLANEKVQKWIQWIRNKKDLSVCMKIKKRR